MAEFREFQRRLSIDSNGSNEVSEDWCQVSGQFFEIEWPDRDYPREVEFPGGRYIEAAEAAGFSVRRISGGDARTPIRCLVLRK